MSQKPLRILVVDDDYDSRMCICDMLVAEGFEVETAVDGSEALRLIEPGKFNLVVLDLNMPVMNGWQFLDELATRPYRNDLRVVVLSAALGPSKLAVDCSLSKPAGIDDLLGAVQGCLVQATG